MAFGISDEKIQQRVEKLKSMRRRPPAPERPVLLDQPKSLTDFWPLGVPVSRADVRIKTADDVWQEENAPQAVDMTALVLARLAPLTNVREHHRNHTRIDQETGEVTHGDVTTLKAPLPAPAELVAVDLNEHARDLRRRTFRLQAEAARLAPAQRVALCHRLPSAGSTVDVRQNAEGRAYFGGVQTCGSVWLCPICAKKITEARRADVQHASLFVRDGGGQLLMLTLTAPHQRHDKLSTLKTSMTAAYRYLVSGKHALSRIVPGYLGAVRALEVTHGDNGWHVHFHVVLALGCELTETEAAELQALIWARWDKATQHAGLGQINAHGVRLDVPRVASLDRDPITDYLCKWGVAEEVSKLHTKTGKAGRTPWQLLEASAAKDRHAGMLWREYAQIFKGGRQLVWSKGFRALVGLQEEVSDEDTAAAQPEAHTLVVKLERREWIAVRAVGSRTTLLDFAEYGVQHVRRYLDQCLEKLDSDAVDKTVRGERVFVASCLLSEGE